MAVRKEAVADAVKARRGCGRDVINVMLKGGAGACGCEGRGCDECCQGL